MRAGHDGCEGNTLARWWGLAFGSSCEGETERLPKTIREQMFRGPLGDLVGGMVQTILATDLRNHRRAEAEGREQDVEAARKPTNRNGNVVERVFHIWVRIILSPGVRVHCSRGMDWGEIGLAGDQGCGKGWEHCGGLEASSVE